MNAIAYQTKLVSDTIHLQNVDELIGKEVIITVIEVEDSTQIIDKVQNKKKLSSLKGKVSKMSASEIDKQLKYLRDEWQRDI